MRKVNLKIQMHNLMTEKLQQGFGVSRHTIKQAIREHKEATGELLKDPSIHAITTAKSYRNTINQFSKFLKEKHPDVWNSKDLSNITREISYQFLQERQEKGLSAWTVSQDLSAINKLLEQDLNKREGDLRYRKSEEVVRSRVEREHDKSYNINNYKDVVEFSNAFGLRRQSLDRECGRYVVKEDVSLFKKGQDVFCSVIEKGGRYREAPCLKGYQEAILSKYNVVERESLTKTQFKDLYNSNNSRDLFERYTGKVDNHDFRREYATNLYKQLVKEKEERGETLKLDKTCKGKKFDSSLVKEVSLALGHSRLDVSLKSYLT